jgi:hypothetical protein
MFCSIIIVTKNVVLHSLMASRTLLEEFLENGLKRSNLTELGDSLYAREAALRKFGEMLGQQHLPRSPPRLR